jgi:hypothetical protein
VTDIKVAHKDLIVATQGRSFWILDDLTPLHQFNGTATVLYAPRDAVRTPARGGGGRGAGIQYPLPGAGINYYLASAPEGEIKLEILDGASKVIRTFTSAAPAAGARSQETEPAPAGEEGEGGFAIRSGPTRLDKTAGLHRFTCDLRYPGPPAGPVVVPGKYAVRLTVGSWTSTQPLTVIEDPRVTKAGVTQADLQEQFDHNMRVRQLVIDANEAAARLRAAPKNERTNSLSAKFLTSPIRYSQPGLLTHITYLYSMTNATDQKIGRDAIERYTVLRKELDAFVAELNQVLGSR